MEKTKIQKSKHSVMKLLQKYTYTICMLKSGGKLLVDMKNPKLEQEQPLASKDVLSLFTNVPELQTVLGFILPVFSRWSFPRRSFLREVFFPQVFSPLSFPATFLCPLVFSLYFFSKQGNQPTHI